jgi:magnesium chelatase subunit I
MSERTGYPFTAIVGQELMKQALMLNLINPRIGGVLIRGEKGTAKSTAVRSLVELMPERRQVEGCTFHCDPDDHAELCDACKRRLAETGELPVETGRMRVVDLPVSATEDRVVGTLDIEEAIKKGEKKFEPGILAQANRNILYVDEVNLLDDHVVDVLLDSAAMGVNTIEREGISYSHPARFVLVGTMNPEEGDLRPQLIDRFGIVADVVGERTVDKRTEVVIRRLEYEQDEIAFAEQFRAQQQALRQQIETASTVLPLVKCPKNAVETAARVAIELNVDGHRADITMIKVAKTLAAMRGQTDINVEDMLTSAMLSLPHRMRRRPFEEGSLDLSVVEQLIRDGMKG